MADLCLTSDTMIQLQTTDDFSGSIYAGNIIITGKLLNYAELKEEEVKFYEISEFDFLPGLLSDIVQNITEKKKSEFL